LFAIILHNEWDVLYLHFTENELMLCPKAVISSDNLSDGCFMVGRCGYFDVCLYT